MGGNTLIWFFEQRGDQAIHFAAHKGHLAVVEALLKAGVDVNTRGVSAHLEI